MSLYPISEFIKEKNYQYFPSFFDKLEAELFFSRLLDTIPWQQGTIKIFGKELLQPRLFCFMADEGIKYSYSNKELITFPWTKDVISIKSKVEKELNTSFNSVLINLYRDGNDSMGWHSDDEKELGQNPKIASITLGYPRKFQFKGKAKNQLTKIKSIELKSGSMFYMFDDFQHLYVHQVPKTKDITESARINLTFRNILY